MYVKHMYIYIYIYIHTIMYIRTYNKEGHGIDKGVPQECRAGS